MQDKQLIDKIEQTQEILLFHLDEAEKQGTSLPADVRKAMDNAEKWNRQVAEASADDVEPRRWEPHELAHALHKHISILPRHMKQEVQEYCYLVDRLPYKADETLGV